MSVANPGWFVRHEFRHHPDPRFTDPRYFDPLLDYKTRAYFSTIRHPYTDYIAFDEYKKAYEAFLNGDDTGFYFVFETPKGNIVTKNIADENIDKKDGEKV